MSNKEHTLSSTDTTSPTDPTLEEATLANRRDFLISLGKWSKVVIGGAILGGAMLPDQDAMAQSRWERFSRDDRPDWDRPAWYNRRPGWYNRGPRWDRPHWHYGRPRWDRPGWYNRRPGWYNRGWYNR